MIDRARDADMICLLILTSGHAIPIAATISTIVCLSRCKFPSRPDSWVTAGGDTAVVVLAMAKILDLVPAREL
jgi:hypothetical protein